MFSRSILSKPILSRTLKKCFTSLVQSTDVCSVGCADSVNQFLDRYDTFMLDCDGVLWKSDHITPVPGISKAIERLQKLNKRVLFVTNNSIESRETLQQKFRKYGFDSPLENIYGNGYVAAVFLKDFLKIDGKVYLVGGSGLKWELDQVGVDHTGFGLDPDSPTSVEHELLNFSFEDNVEAVLVGFDEYLSYNKIFKASTYICDPRCHFIATNDVEKGIYIGNESAKRRMPLAGTMVNAIADTANRKPVVVGKPNRVMFDCILGRHRDVDLARTVFIGDRLKTDMEFSKSVGIHSALVLTGISELTDIRENPELAPNYVMNSLADIIR